MNNIDKTQSPLTEAEIWFNGLEEEPLPTDGTVESFVTFHKNPYQRQQPESKVSDPSKTSSENTNLIEDVTEKELGTAYEIIGAGGIPQKKK